MKRKQVRGKRRKKQMITNKKMSGWRSERCRDERMAGKGVKNEGNEG